MYLAGTRGITQGDGFRSLHSLNYGNLEAEGHSAFRRLTAFNEESLLPGKEVAITTSRPVEVILLPVAGGLELSDVQGESVFVGVGETFHFSAFPESGFRVCNPYPDNQIAYIQLHLSPASFSDRIDPSPLTTFSLDTPDRLVPVFSDGLQKVTGFLGKYGGRKEGLYFPKALASGLFAYVIQGAFEVQNRLLEAGDALSLQYIDSLEFEALSNEAIILVIEVE
jgi:quercetin 2,3-dioxygenase